jgi:outer membrane receptor protein involved in Fe transport
LEFGAAYRITPELTLGLNTAFTHARLTTDSPEIGGTSGDQLPLSARFAGYLYADYVHPVNDQYSFIAGASYRYKDGILNQFPGQIGGTEPLGPQDIVNLYTGWSSGATTLRLYGKNVLNNQSYNGIQYLLTPAYPRAVPVQPATFGLSLDYRFH